MCGIVGYIGKKEATPLLLEGLRGWNIGAMTRRGFAPWRTARCRCANAWAASPSWRSCSAQQPALGGLGISHTRWATHGLPSDANAHPHLDQSGKLALVHNGIIENYAALRQKLLNDNHKFLSQTDTEVLAHLVGIHLDQRLARGEPLTPRTPG